LASFVQKSICAPKPDFHGRPETGVLSAFIGVVPKNRVSHSKRGFPKADGHMQMRAARLFFILYGWPVPGHAGFIGGQYGFSRISKASQKQPIRDEIAASHEEFEV
jgi:hypothetical protein